MIKTEFELKYVLQSIQIDEIELERKHLYEDFSYFFQ
jgi:hypothetical protein